MTSSIRIRRVNITECSADCIVNSANNRLRRGSGVCGEIFRAAGSELLSGACAAIGSCDTGEAVITPAFHLNAKYIIHTVGPVWHGGFHHELQKLYCCYGKSLLLAQEHNCHSIVFPMLLTGVFNNPVQKAWKVAIEACRNFLEEAGDYKMDICFAIPDKDEYDAGYRALGSSQTENAIYFKEDDEAYSFLTNTFPCSFRVEGVDYSSVIQYVAGRKALMCRDLETYGKIMDTQDSLKCEEYERKIVCRDVERWENCLEEVMYRAVYAKFSQSDFLARRLRQTGNLHLSETGEDYRGGVFDGGDAEDRANLLGQILMKVRTELK